MIFFLISVFYAASPEPENTLDFSGRSSQQVNWIVVNLKLFVLNQAWCEGLVFFKTGVLFGFSRKDLHHVKWKWVLLLLLRHSLSLIIHLFWALVLLCLQLTFAYEVPLLLVPFATVSILYSIVSIFDDLESESTQLNVSNLWSFVFGQALQPLMQGMIKDSLELFAEIAKTTKTT